MKIPFLNRSSKSPAFAFCHEMRGDNLCLYLRQGDVNLPGYKWAATVPEASAALAELFGLSNAVAAEREGPDNEATQLSLSPDLVAQLSSGSAAVLRLPPPTTLALDIKPLGRVDNDDFHVKVTWLRLGGQPVRVAATGALLKHDNFYSRVPEPIWSIYKLAQKLSQPLEKAERFQVLAQLSSMWVGQPAASVTSEPYLKDMRVHYAAAVSLKLRTLTPGNTEFDPILFGANLISNAEADADSEGRMPDEDWDSILSPRAQKLFAEDRFRRESGVRPVYVLRDGEYVFIDPELRPVLNAIRKLQDSAEHIRRAFILNPRAILREQIGIVGSEASPLERLFIETEQFSERVAGVDIWRATILPWVLPSGNNKWLPEKFGLKVSDEYFAIAPENVAEALERFESAQAAGLPTVNVEGILESTREHKPPLTELAVTAKTHEALRSLSAFSNAASEGGVGEAPAWHGLPGQKLFIVVKENFEEVEFSSSGVEAEALDINSHALVTPPAKLKTELKPHQVDGLKWLVGSVQARHSGVLLGDDMGLGKTLQAIAFMAWLQEEMRIGRRQQAPILIVAPTGLLGSWRDEIDKHLASPYLGRLVPAFGGDIKWLREETGLSVKDIETGQAALSAETWRDAGVVLTTYETLRDYHFSFARSHFALVVYDEIQKLKNPVSQMTRASKALNAGFIIGMTGTPVENRLQDLWSIMDVISPGLLGSSRDFEKRYPASDAERLQDLKAFLTSASQNKPAHMLRRLKSEALKGLPAKTIRSYVVEMPPQQATAYAELVMRAAAGASSGTIGRGGMLQILAHMRGVSLHPIDPANAPTDLDEYARDSARLSKTLEILDEIELKNEKALIFVEDLAMQERLCGLIYQRFKLRQPPMRINGSVPGPKRQDMVRAFQQDTGRFGVMILSPKAGGVGLTLTSANHVIHLSRWWNPAVEDQATDRVFRIGQTKEVFVHLPMAAHPNPVFHDSSFDLRLNALLERKRQLTRDLFMPPEADDGDISELFSEVAGGREPQVGAEEIIQTEELRAPSGSPVAKAARETLSLGGKVVQTGAKVWRVGPGQTRPTAPIFALFKDRDVNVITIRDPYALGSDRAIDAQIAFLEGIREVCRSLEAVKLEYAPEASNDDAFSRKSFGEKYSNVFSGDPPHLNLIRRPKRSYNDDFHDRSVEINVKSASGKIQSHEILIGRGLEALFNDRLECTIVYSPPIQ